MDWRNLHNIYRDNRAYSPSINIRCPEAVRIQAVTRRPSRREEGGWFSIRCAVGSRKLEGRKMTVQLTRWVEHIIHDFSNNKSSDSSMSRYLAGLLQRLAHRPNESEHSNLLHPSIWVIYSSLGNRNYFTIVRNTASSIRKVGAWVPQGSIFSLVNDIPFVEYRLNTILHIQADDTCTSA